MKEFKVLGGTIVQGGAEEVAHFYSKVGENPSESSPVLMLVNVAKRSGEATVCDEPNGRIYWLPMQEAGADKTSEVYLKRYGRELVAGLKHGATVVVSCQEGVHRSVEFARQLKVACLQAASADARASGVVCGRFPNQRICGCTIPCRLAMREVRLSQIRDKLYVGPVQAAYQDQEMMARGIRAVVNASGSEYSQREGVEYLSIALDDEPEAQLLPALQLALPFMRERIAAGDAVLVHCEAGKSRSVSICAGWLMSSEGLSAQEALLAVEAAHPRADANRGFRAQLLALETLRPDWFCAEPS